MSLENVTPLTMYDRKSMAEVSDIRFKCDERNLLSEWEEPRTSLLDFMLNPI